MKAIDLADCSVSESCRGPYNSAALQLARRALVAATRFGSTAGAPATKALLLLAVATSLLRRPLVAEAQFGLGAQDRSNAAREMIVLAVQQGIDSLPPMSGQAFVYEYDPTSDTYERSKWLGPTAFRTPQTVGAGNLSVRLATSYFDLSESFGPTPYLIQSDAAIPGQTQPLTGVAEFGLNTSAKVGLINLSAVYGIINRVDITLNLPIVIVDAQASEVFTSSRVGLRLPPRQAKVFAVPVVNGDVPGALQRLGDFLQPGGPLVLRTETFTDLGIAFNAGTQAGVGRINVGAKGILFSDSRAQLAFAPEFYFPSPNEEQFAGPDSAAILPRFIGAFAAADRLRFHVDAGYNYDFDHDELRSFVWDVGAAVPGQMFSVDFGVGGSKFNQGITWTPAVATSPGRGVFPGSTSTALGDITLGDNFVNFLGGLKFRLTDALLISGAVTVPLNSDGFRAAAMGTLAVEYWFPGSGM